MPRPRPLVVLGLITTWLVSGCVADGPQRSPAEGRTVTVQAGNGRVTVPATSTGVLAMDESTGLQLLAMGVVPRAVVAREDVPATELLREEGVPLIARGRTEQVAAAKPSLIVGMMTPRNDELVARLSRIAPVVFTHFTDPWPEQLRVNAAVTGRPERAERLIGRIDDAISRLAVQVGTRLRGRTVSVLSLCGGGNTLCIYDDRTVLGDVLTRLGLRRPSAQIRANSSDDRTAWAGFDTISAELLGAHGGDIVVALDGGEGPTVLDHPLLHTEHAITARVEFDGWFYNTPLTVAWVLHDLRAVLFGEGRVAARGDARALWAEAVSGP
ncbi:ABC transporter substrate-binding protein [Pseudonocardia spinosispora]|uniref:ABC transporter substrate-binding protein n=1 Tax=Pseudonocardia spinosispora TaxID=103441 RepID=UPI00040E7600|nr:ABC transporter substrate-binding protein [Pseudonocardia spinosispora]